MNQDLRHLAVRNGNISRPLEAAGWALFTWHPIRVLTDGAFDQKLLFARLKSFLEEE